MKKNKIAKHLQKVANEKLIARPILQNALYETDGTVSVTDSHRLIRVSNYHELKNRTLVNLSSLQVAIDEKEQYPRLERLLPREFNGEYDVKVSDLKALVRLDVGNKNKNASMKVDNDKNVLIFTLENTTYNIDISTMRKKNDDKDFEIYFNATYFADMARMIKDVCGDYDTVTLSFVSKVRPFLATCGNIEYLITPVRKH